MSSIPTTYNGIRFRSRLEAKWACFWDLEDNTKDDHPDFRNHWQYEPFELPGWIPDFIITSTFFAPSLIEIKPISSLNEFTNSKDWVKVKSALIQENWFGKNQCGLFEVNGISPVCRWILRANGKWEQIVPMLGFNSSEWKKTERNWAKACNETQWKAPRGRR